MVNEHTCLDTCLIISRRSASASSCILAVTSLLPARRGFPADLGGDMALLLEGGGDGDLCRTQEHVGAATLLPSAVQSADPQQPAVEWKTWQLAASLVE